MAAVSQFKSSFDFGCPDLESLGPDVEFCLKVLLYVRYIAFTRISLFFSVGNWTLSNASDAITQPL
jgi:hypothetical protein